MKIDLQSKKRLIIAAAVMFVFGGMAFASAEGKKQAKLYISVSKQFYSRKIDKLDDKFRKKIFRNTEIKIRVVVKPDGSIKSAKVLKSSGNPALDKTVLTKVNKMFFEPLAPDAKQENKQGILIFKWEIPKTTTLSPEF